MSPFILHLNDRAENFVRAAQHFLVRTPQDSQSSQLELLESLQIIFDLSQQPMNTSLYFDYQFEFCAIEVDDIATERVLTNRF